MSFLATASRVLDTIKAIRDMIIVLLVLLILLAAMILWFLHLRPFGRISVAIAFHCFFMKMLWFCESPVLGWCLLLPLTISVLHSRPTYVYSWIQLIFCDYPIASMVGLLLGCLFADWRQMYVVSSQVLEHKF